jgi:hypothetical protein
MRKQRFAALFSCHKFQQQLQRIKLLTRRKLFTNGNCLAVDIIHICLAIREREYLIIVKWNLGNKNHYYSEHQPSPLATWELSQGLKRVKDGNALSLKLSSRNLSRNTFRSDLNNGRDYKLVRLWVFHRRGITYRRRYSGLK